MTISRRNLFSLMGGAVSAPIVAKLPAPVPSPYQWREHALGYTVTEFRGYVGPIIVAGPLTDAQTMAMQECLRRYLNAREAA